MMFFGKYLGSFELSSYQKYGLTMTFNNNKGMLQDEIKQSLNAAWDETMYGLVPKANRLKGNSFTELSDWSEKHRYLNDSIILPKISSQNHKKPNTPRIFESQSSDHIDRGKYVRGAGAKSVDIKFGLPHGLRGFQKSFYQNCMKEKTQKKRRNISPRQYISLLQQIRQPKNTPIHPKTQQQIAKQSIINQVMNRRNRMKKQHFLQEYLTANKMSPSEEINFNK